MKRTCFALVLLLSVAISSSPAQVPSNQNPQVAAANAIRGFRDSAQQISLEQRFLAVPTPQSAESHLKILTAAPHLAGTPEDRETAEYVAKQFRAAGLETRIDEYKVWLDYPGQILVETVAPANLKMVGPSKENIDGDPFQNDPRVIPAFNGGSPSGDVTAEVVYANYGRPEDFRKLEELGIDVKGKIVIVRYGQNFRGVKVYIAQEKGAAGVIIYSDPWDDGYFRGDVLPDGPYRPSSGVQRGSVQYMFEYPGDPTTPGVAALPALADSKRIDPAKALNLARIPSTPLSYGDVAPILKALSGPATPREWQGALPFTYHVGPGPVKVHLKVEHNYQLRSIWNVVGTVKGTEFPDEWIIAGNHRDAWIYGATDPNSGSAAMLEAVRSAGELLKTGWKPKRTIVFASWDAEEQGLIGSTEFGEHFAEELSKKAVAYFNTDVAVIGPNFGASAVPSLKQFIREVTKSVPSPKGGTVYDQWRATGGKRNGQQISNAEVAGMPRRTGNAPAADVTVGDLGSGSDYTVFLQNLGIASTDIGSGGGAGVYHSVFDNFATFKKFIDPTFQYEQQMARVYGLQVLRMAQADVLPFEYNAYGREIHTYLEDVRRRADDLKLGSKLDFGVAFKAADRLAGAGSAITSKASLTNLPPAAAVAVNKAMREAERALLSPEGLPRRPFYKHVIYAPGEYTGYAAVVLPGVNEALDRKDGSQAASELRKVTDALNRAAQVLEGAAK